MTQITANDLKTRGIAAIEASLADGRLEAMVSVRGADRFVVMSVEHYQHLRECELEAALAEGREDIAAGRFVVESPAAHMKRLKAMAAVDASANTKSVAQRAVRSSAKLTAKPAAKPPTKRQRQ